MVAHMDDPENTPVEKEPGEPVQVAGTTLVCPVCRHDRFWARRSMLNTRVKTFFKLDWTDKQADNYVCERCGYIFWFYRE